MPTQHDDDLRSEASEPPYQSDAAEHLCPPSLISQPQTGSLIPVCSERRNHAVSRPRDQAERSQ
jgi:hypothetical protein